MEFTTKQKQFVEKTLKKFEISPMVSWDRLFFDERLKILSIYGWIDREADSYKDFVQINFVFSKLLKTSLPKVELSGTSSAKFCDRICKKLHGKKTTHNPCERVEHHFLIPNSIKLSGGKKNEMSNL